jgi:hypothetical protein
MLTEIEMFVGSSVGQKFDDFLAEKSRGLKAFKPVEKSHFCLKKPLKI